MIKKRLLALIISLSVAVTALASPEVVVRATDTSEDVEVMSSGTVNSVEWSIDTNGHLVLQGSGDLGDERPWKKYSASIRSAEIKVLDITNLSNLFPKCYSLETVDLSALDTSKVTDMSSMFADCFQLQTIDLLGFDTSNVTNMSHMFAHCHNLQNIDLSSFDTSKVTDMSSMFQDCYDLTNLDLTVLDTSKVTNMSSMFASCHKLTDLDLSTFDTTEVTDMSSMFEYCNRITNLDLSGFNTSNVTNMSNMFWNSYALTSLDLSNFDTSKVINMNSMFDNCYGLESLDLRTFNTSNVTDMSAMFQYCSKLTELNIEGFDTSKVTNMKSMFENCENLKYIDLNGFDTSNVTNMSSMFRFCQKISDLELSSFDTSNVISMEHMFYECNGLTTLNLSKFNTSNVYNMNYMFEECDGLKELDLSGFDTSNLKYISGMFKGCLNLKTLDLSGCDFSKINSMVSSVFSNCGVTKIYTPKNLSQSIDLPVRKYSWYDSEGNVYTQLPINLEEGICLQIIVEEHEHIYADENWVVKQAATCTEEGLEICVCSVDCCEEQVERAIPALEHSYLDEDWNVEKAATCAEEGLETCVCSRENCEEKISRVISKLPHTIVKDEAKKATFKRDGKTAGSHCSVCGEVTEEQSIIPRVESIVLSTKKYTYNGKTRKPTVALGDTTGRPLVKGKDYTVTYEKGRKDPGVYDVYVKLIGKYSGNGKISFTIYPKKPTNVTAKLYGHDDVSVSWEKVTGVDGYRVYYKKSSSSTYKNYKTTTKTSAKFANLTDGVKYNFKVVPYFKEDGKTIKGINTTSTSIYTLKKISTPKVLKSSTLEVHLKWVNIPGETGYQISKSTSKTGTNIVYTYKTREGNDVFVSAKKGKTYYYKVRAYKVEDGKKIYGPWSNTVKYVKK